MEGRVDRLDPLLITLSYPELNLVPYSNHADPSLLLRLLLTKPTCSHRRYLVGKWIKYVFSNKVIGGLSFFSTVKGGVLLNLGIFSHWWTFSFIIQKYIVLPFEGLCFVKVLLSVIRSHFILRNIWLGLWFNKLFHYCVIQVFHTYNK